MLVSDVSETSLHLARAAVDTDIRVEYEHECRDHSCCNINLTYNKNILLTERGAERRPDTVNGGVGERVGTATKLTD